MVSSLNPAYLHLSREELFGSKDWLGYKNIVCWDVSGRAVLERMS